MIRRVVATRAHQGKRCLRMELVKIALNTRGLGKISGIVVLIIVCPLKLFWRMAYVKIVRNFREPLTSMIAK